MSPKNGISGREPERRQRREARGDVVPFPELRAIEKIVELIVTVRESRFVGAVLDGWRLRLAGVVPGSRAFLSLVLKGWFEDSGEDVARQSRYFA